MAKKHDKLFFYAVKTKNHQRIQAYIEQFDFQTIPFLEIKDETNRTIFHYAAMHGLIKLFYTLLLPAKQELKHNQALLQRFIHLNGKTPWHDAAQFGHSEFFQPPGDLVAFEIWQLLKLQWLNLPDDQGNTPLHMAVVYGKKDSKETIKRKKKTCLALTTLPELAINSQNANGNTALHVAIMGGCFETAQVLLRFARNKKNNLQDFYLKNNKELTPHDLAVQLGHQRLDNLYLLSCHPKHTKLKEQHHRIGFHAMQVYACNAHLSDEDFFKRLKLADLNQNEIREIIQLRLHNMRKKYRNKSMMVAAIASLCPAFFVSVFAEYFPIPLLGTILTGIIFPITYIPFVYVCYQSRMREHNAVTAETIYFSWLATTLSNFLKPFNRIFKTLIQEASTLAQDSCDATNEEQLSAMQTRYANLQNHYHQLLQKMSSIIECQADKKPKLVTMRLSRAELKQKKQLGQLDPKKSSHWMNRGESIRAFIGHTADVLCPLGAGVELAATISVLVASSIAVSFPPILIAAAVVSGTIFLGGLIGYVLYKACYKKDQAEIGENNRKLVIAYDACRHNQHLLKIEQLNNRLKKCLNDVHTKIQIKVEDKKTYQASLAKQMVVKEANCLDSSSVSRYVMA
ncbi:MAG: hypothetical protein A3F14_06785 [Gammaproteobacteria bacterium RIFCSPHIGHO2_12_FULL_43_28]|nr:MAG: hypothetical protein A3F14_06785 [Gammaproteobacteria bacterium RIFCSPHIGHO2_12_FULL_43_28]